MIENDVIFQPLKFRNLVVKNRIFRSNMSGRFDNYDGSGTQTRINWEERFARGGVGAILTSFVPVHIRGRVLPNYATIDQDARIPFWRQVGEAVHKYDCKVILQLSHSGRQQDIVGVENMWQKALSSTGRNEPLDGFQCEAMTREQIQDCIHSFAEGAYRAKKAGLDGVELLAANGYLFTQFLSSAINDREDQYGGSLENRARFLLEVIGAIRKKVGDNFHLQVKISAIDYANAVYFWKKKGNTLEDSIQVCQWVEEAGVDALHVSAGCFFPHPLNPPGEFPHEETTRVYDVMIPSEMRTFWTFLTLRFKWLQPIYRYLWNHAKPKQVEGINIPAAQEIKKHLKIPVICTGGFQTASYIRQVLNEGACDAVSIARPLIANNDLVKIFEAGIDHPLKPCTYCNKCLINALENPLGCYELARYDGDYDKMVKEIMSVFEPSLGPLPIFRYAPGADASIGTP